MGKLLNGYSVYEFTYNTTGQTPWLSCSAGICAIERRATLIYYSLTLCFYLWSHIKHSWILVEFAEIFCIALVYEKKNNDLYHA
jgi:hypothetical protein